MSNKSKNGATSIPVLPPIPLSASAQGSPSKLTSRGKDKADIPTKLDPSLPQTHEPNTHHKIIPHRFLSSTEWAVIANGIGGMKDGESHKPAHPTHWLWPPLGMPRGLYREVVSHKYRFYFLFHLTSILRWMLMVVQLFVGAALTALGAMSLENGKPITILGAVNTVVAGFLALLHNSGLPDRYLSDMAEFEDIEDRIKEVLNSSLVPAGQTTDQVLAEFFDLYREAKSTVAVNMPANYATKHMLSKKQANNKVPPGSDATLANMNRGAGFSCASSIQS
ncbi:hypothetical protein NOR_02130 [Metarhizium rileyi]|uniref:SMODS and SLOG-associating 2TM effector domain-containing protein n=1 Tax=Metarhizium rileyi (strain RCEF 4871) TaxID=1649241 RepID=A0A162LZL7_METRR|nr:hypothetical protein NOR_02130 [Metarhizium rileyi RCEF 4871]TWU76596.1 hypothetical protein ED733_008066 [Metarhizium rileyi]